MRCQKTITSLACLFALLLSAGCGDAVPPRLGEISKELGNTMGDLTAAMKEGATEKADSAIHAMMGMASEIPKLLEKVSLPQSAKDKLLAAQEKFSGLVQKLHEPFHDSGEEMKAKVTAAWEEHGEKLQGAVEALQSAILLK